MKFSATMSEKPPAWISFRGANVMEVEMIEGLEALRDINVLSTFVKMLCAMLCGGAIGLEREYKRRSAGFRTHILICLGACMTAMTGQYIVIILHYSSDMARLGAQVIAGIGFIGAGAIIVTQKNQVRGLTTSAGLWATAVTGLAFGSGFYEGGILTTILILLAETVLSRLEYASHVRAKRRILYVEFTRRAALDFILSEMKSRGDQIEDIEMTQDAESKEKNGKTQRAYVYYRTMGKESEPETDWNQVPGIDMVELI